MTREAARSGPTMGHVRPVVPDDIPRVAELYAKVFGPRGGGAMEGLREVLRDVFFRHPWLDDRLPSLVYQAREGRILGCLGVVPRPMSLKGRPIQAAISHTVMVDPDCRTTLAAVELIRAFLSGPQDVSISQGTSLSRRIFEGVGGSTSLLHSFGWTRVLRPSRYVLAFLRRRGLSTGVSAALTLLCRAADALAGRVHPFRFSSAGLTGEPLDPETLATCVSVFLRDRALQPTYDAASLKWLLELLARENADAPLRRIVVRDASGETVGGYLYYGHATGLGEVVQVVARPTSVEAVLDHLFNDAYRHGLVAVSGQLDPPFLNALAARHCLFNRGDGSWLLFHAKDHDITAAIHRGDALLTRLDAEWWIGFVLRCSLERSHLEVTP